MVPDRLRAADPFRGQRVVVIGAGKSAVQITCELASVARVGLAVRRPVRFGPQRVLGRDIHFWLRWTGLDRTRWVSDVSAPVIDDGRYRAAIRRGQPDERPMFRAFDVGGVEWADGRREAVDAVIFATGFRPDVSFLEGLPVVDEAGRLRQRAGRSTAVAGIYFVGMPGQRTFASATLRGAGADARIVVRAIERHLAAGLTAGRSRPAPGHCCRPSPA
jgi:putative flavoprotein involved in K+ transport